MVYSKHNIFSKIKDSENSFIVNLLSGNADIVFPPEAQMIIDFKSGKIIPDQFAKNLYEKGYLVDKIEEDKLFKKKYLDFIDDRDEDEVQLFFVTNYSCNFACTYCYQDEYSNLGNKLSFSVIDSFFKYIKQEFAGRKKYITIFGGEPLLNSAEQKELIAYMLKQANIENLEVCFVTNGYFLNEYIDILSLARRSLKSTKALDC